MISFTTFQDAIDHGTDYLGSNASDQAKRDVVRAVLEAYRDLANAFNWSYLFTRTRIITSATFDGPTEEDTIAYDHTGGTYERMVTLTGGTWPTWASDGFLVVGDLCYKVDERKSATVVTLDDSLNPGADLAGGTAFSLCRDTYVLPEDFVAQDAGLYDRNFGTLQFTHPRDWAYDSRYSISAGDPSYFTITGDRKHPGRLVIRLFPWPTQAKPVDFLYKRRPRALLTARESTGRIAVTADSNVVTGTGTAFAPRHVGSVLRVSSSTSKLPASLIMASLDTPAAVFESVITAYVSPTSVVIADDLDATYAGVCYTVSDPIEIEQGAMLNCFLRGVEKHIGMSRTLKDKPSAAKQYLDALAEAKSADSRSFAGRVVNQGGSYRPRLRDRASVDTNVYET